MPQEQLKFLYRMMNSASIGIQIFPVGENPGCRDGEANSRLYRVMLNVISGK